MTGPSKTIPKIWDKPMEKQHKPSCNLEKHKVCVIQLEGGICPWQVCTCNQSEKEINYMQVLGTVECGACHPEKFTHCDVVFGGIKRMKCECICHPKAGIITEDMVLKAAQEANKYQRKAVGLGEAEDWEKQLEFYFKTTDYKNIRVDWIKSLIKNLLEKKEIQFRKRITNIGSEFRNDERELLLAELDTTIKEMKNKGFESSTILDAIKADLSWELAKYKK